MKKLALGGACIALASPTQLIAETVKKSKQAGIRRAETQTSDPKPKFGPAPAWVRKEAAGKVSSERRQDPFALLLSSSQEYLTPTGVENTVEYVVQPLNQVGLQAIGNISIPWNADRSDLTIHRVSIGRNGNTIDALRPADVSVIRRETKLDQSTLTGLRTVVLPVRGLAVGDTLQVAFTYKTKARFPGKTEEVQDLTTKVPVARLVRRFVISKDLPVRWKVPAGVNPAATAEDASMSERTYILENLEPAKKRSFVPERFTRQFIQVSAFTSWADVAATLTQSFDAARKTEDGSEVAQIAAKIAASTQEPERRLLAALRTAQDELRYVALLLGEGDYKPVSANEVWAQRYGDCKGKTAFLLALLDRLGIPAEPVLASIAADDGLDTHLPSLALMDHVYVRARVGGSYYYLDGTQFGQRNIEELKTGTTRHILPIAANAELLTTPDLMPSAPLTETNLVWDARGGVLGPIPFEATLTLRGAAAADMRASAAASTDRTKLIESYRDKVVGVANEELEHVATEEERPDGSYVVRFKGKVERDWRPVEGLKGNRLEFSQSPLTWKSDFDREDEDAKEIPVAMVFPFWERTVEKIILPAGGKDFTVEAPDVDETVAVTQLTRTVRAEGGVITAVSDFKRLARELSPDGARKARKALDRIADQYAFVVSKKKLKLSD